MALERGSGVALWRQIEEEIAETIRSGEMAPGSRVPTELALAERFGVNRHTLRRAVQALVERGLLRVEQGRGTFVQEHVLDYFLGRRTRFSEIVAKQNRSPGGELIGSREVAADATIARELGIAVGARVFLLETLGRVDGRPVSIGSHYFPAERFPGLVEAYGEARSITRLMERFGCGDYVRRTTRITARLPDPADAERLQQARTRPVLFIESVNVDRDGRPVEYGVARFAADRMQIVVET